MRPAYDTLSQLLDGGGYHRPDGDGGWGLALDVVHEGGSQGGEAELVDAEGAGQGMARHALHDVCPAHYHTALGAAEELVAGEEG